MKLTAGIMLVFLILTGCVTSAAIKQASTQHATNLSQLAVASENYRTGVKSYYGDLVAAQCQAYVAQHLNKSIQKLAMEQYETIAKYGPEGASIATLPRTLPDQASKDFITSSTQIRMDQDLWNKNFQFWLNAEGEDLAAKRKGLKEWAEKISDPKAKENLQREANRTDEDLTYVSVAIDLRRQAADIDQKLGRITQQVRVMQKFHAIIDEYLGIDATDRWQGNRRSSRSWCQG